MAGDLWQGYLDAQAADVAETEREEDKKRQRLNEQLQKLNMESTRRGIEKQAWDFKIEQATQAEREKNLSVLEGFLDPDQMAVLRLGGDLSEFQDVTEEQYLPSADELRNEYLIETGQKPEAGGGSSQDKWEYIKSLTTKDPTDLTPKEQRYLIGEGYRYDTKLRAWAKPKAGKGNIYNTGNPEVDAALKAAHGGGGKTWEQVLDPASGAYIHAPKGMAGFSSPGQGTGLENLDLGGIGQQPPGTVTEEMDKFIEEARVALKTGKTIPWEVVAAENPDWNIFYIKQKLGVNE